MTKIYRVISNILTLPGVLLNTVVTNFIAYSVDLDISRVNYLALDDSPPITHEIPQTYKQALGITFLPFIVMSSFAVITFIIINECLTLPTGNLSNWGLFYMWFGVSFASHSFPFTVNGDEFGVQSMRLFKEGKFMATIGIPLVFVIHFLEASKLLFFNVFYGVLLMMIVYKGWYQ